MIKSLGVSMVWAGIVFGAVSCASLTDIPETSAPMAMLDGNYRLDVNHAALQFKISHLGISDYIGRFTEMAGELSFDQDNPEATRLTATVDIASLKVMPFSFIQTLIGPDWLDAQRYPQASFELTNLDVTGDNQGRAFGNLTLRGMTHPMVFDVNFTGAAHNPANGNYSIAFQARGQFKRSDYGINKYLSIAGDKFDFDTVRLEFDGEFIRK